MKIRRQISHLGIASFVLLAVFMVFGILGERAQAAEVSSSAGQTTSMQMMERAEIIVYGEPGRGGLIDRLNTIERELFGRDLPGSISERHSAILDFLEVGTPDQPSMLFRLGILEWLIGESTQARIGALSRVERLENDLDGTMQYGRPLAMRIERLLGSLLADRLTAQEVVLPAATVLQAQFLDEVRNATARGGDRVFLALTNDVLVGNVLIAPRGSLIDASVRSVRRPRMFGGSGRITIDYNALIPLGPQRPFIAEGEASRRTAESMEGVLGAGGAAIGGAFFLGPLGLGLGALIRGPAANIYSGDIVFVETEGDIRVFGYLVPDNLRIAPNATVRETTVNVLQQPQVGEREIIQLPPEHQVN